jgi:t-SNARE complex subunit (syntaxin)
MTDSRRLRVAQELRKVARKGPIGQDYRTALTHLRRAIDQFEQAGRQLNYEFFGEGSRGKDTASLHSEARSGIRTINSAVSGVEKLHRELKKGERELDQLDQLYADAKNIPW